jgi:methylenetetrahydrofolate reductase (NADPH)
MFQTSSAAVAALAKCANIEVIPLKGAEKHVRDLPTATRVTITCSPKFGLERTLQHVAHARDLGYHVVPHLAARQVHDTAELASIVERLDSLGIDDVYVIGGDASEAAGDFTSAFDLLHKLDEIGHNFRRLGIACYPEGHPHISDKDLRDALAEKQQYANYLVSQLCFDAEALLQWIRATRGAGIDLPLRIGLAAPLNTRKLVELSLKIGVGSSVRFLSKQNGVVSNLVLSRDYEPEMLLKEIADEQSFPELNVEGIHLFSFNQIERTMQWQHAVAGGISA